MSEPQERKTLLVARAALWKTPRKEEILVGKRPEHSSNYPGRWEMPGGKVETDETPIDGALREVPEETGLSIIRTPFVSFVHRYLMVEPEAEGSKFYGYEITTHMIEALVVNPQALFALPPEHELLEWVDLDEAERRNLIPQARFALPYLRTRQREAQPKVYAIPEWKPQVSIPLLTAVTLR